jgi:hypothetical protein
VRHDRIKSYSLKLDSAAGFDYYDYKTQKFEVLPEHKRWGLLAHNYDSSRIRTTLGFEMGRRVLKNMGWQPHADWVFFFLNGEYKGVFILSEIIKPDEGRMNITGGFIVEMNNTNWYANDIQDRGNEFVFDEMYTFMTSHQNTVGNSAGNDGGSGEEKQQGVAFSFKDPDSSLGWYYPDPPEGTGNLTYADTTHYPRRAIAMMAKLAPGTGSNRRSVTPGDWIVPDDFGQTYGMGSWRMLVRGNPGQNNGGIYGTRTLSQVYPGWESSAFVTMSKFIQDAEDAIYTQDRGAGGTGGYHNYIDIDAFIDWHIAIEMTSNWEIGSMNGHYMYFDPKIGKLKMGPVWDLDNGWDTWPPANIVRDSPFWYKELLKDPYYVTRFKARWNVVRTQFRPELDGYIDATNARFQRITGYNNQPIWIDGGRTGFKNVITDRMNSLNPAFNGL